MCGESRVVIKSLPYSECTACERVWRMAYDMLRGEARLGRCAPESRPVRNLHAVSPRKSSPSGRCLCGLGVRVGCSSFRRVSCVSTFATDAARSDMVDGSVSARGVPDGSSNARSMRPSSAAKSSTSASAAPRRPSSARPAVQSPRSPFTGATCDNESLYSFTSSCGPQLNGRYASSPSHSFGRSSTAAKVFISKTLTQDLVGIDSPGPKYNPPPDPATPTPPSFSFPHTSYRNAGPQIYRAGPAQLMMPSSFGEQLETHKPSSMVISFGRADAEPAEAESS